MFFFFKCCCIIFLFKINKMNKQTYICTSCVFVVSCSVALNRPHTHMHTHTTRNREACTIHLKPRALHLSSKNHFLLILPRPPFHLKGLWSQCITLNRPVKRHWVGGRVGGGHVYRCYASSQCTNHDDNLNDDDDKDDDSEECRLTEHLTPVSR